jgi:hypothetical protein
MSAWKDLERRICRALGGERSGPLGKGCSDCTAAVPFSVECKRSVRPGPPVLSAWIEQARAHGKLEDKPWLVVVAGHRTHRPVVALDFWTFTEIAQRAGLIGEVMVSAE